MKGRLECGDDGHPVSKTKFAGIAMQRTDAVDMSLAHTGVDDLLRFVPDPKEKDTETQKRGEYESTQENVE